MANHDQVDPARWLWRALAAFVVVVGWLFILWQNSFHIAPPTVFLGIAYFALVGVIYNLFRTGAAAAKAPEPGEDLDDSTWGKPIGAIGELEREKKTLLKAIKEAEFDREMGKLSVADASAMIAVYRARAIEVIKEIERLAGENAGLSKRDQIEREIRARLELEVKPKQKAKQKAKDAKAKAKAGGATKPAPAPAAAAAADPSAFPAMPADASDDDDSTDDAAKVDAAKADDDVKADAAKVDAKADDAKASTAETATTTDDAEGQGRETKQLEVGT